MTPEPSIELRQLCAGAHIKDRNMAAFALSSRRQTLDNLYHQGWAERHSNGESGKYETFTFVATAKLREWAHQQGLDRKTFDQALVLIDVKKARARYMAERRAEREHRPVVPDIKQQALGPLATVNEDGEFSSRSLTDWYVREFERINHLVAA